MCRCVPPLENMSPSERAKLVELLGSVNERIAATQDLVIRLQTKKLPVEDAEQTLWTLLAMRRAYQRRLEADGCP